MQAILCRACSQTLLMLSKIHRRRASPHRPRNTLRTAVRNFYLAFGRPRLFFADFPFHWSPLAKACSPCWVEPRHSRDSYGHRRHRSRHHPLGPVVARAYYMELCRRDISYSGGNKNAPMVFRNLTVVAEKRSRKGVAASFCVAHELPISPLKIGYCCAQKVDLSSSRCCRPKLQKTATNDTHPIYGSRESPTDSVCAVFLPPHT